jgi:hypothetical protein
MRIVTDTCVLVAAAQGFSAVRAIARLCPDAAQGRRADFEQFLSMVPEVPVDEADR